MPNDFDPLEVMHILLGATIAVSEMKAAGLSREESVICAKAVIKILETAPLTSDDPEAVVKATHRSSQECFTLVKEDLQRLKAFGPQKEDVVN